MALVRKCSDQKSMKKKVAGAVKAMVAESRPFMLKDYLMDDMSSCSSNGFKSYPRRQCCSTVRFQNRPRNRPKPPAIKRSRSRAAASITMSALQRASAAVFNAVKLLPFHSVKSGGAEKVVTRKRIFLPRSFSKRLLRRSFWKKKTEEPDRRSRLFGELIMEKEKPSDESTTSSAITAVTASSSNSDFNSFTEVDFSPGTLRSGTQDDVVGGETDLLSGQEVSATDGHDSAEAATTTVWRNDEEKEQFSPVSILDCPFEDEDEEDEEQEESKSQFQRNLVRVEGTKQKVVQKTRRLESVAELEPLDLEERIALSEHEEAPLVSSMQDHNHRTSISTNVKVNEGEYELERELEELLKRVKSTMFDTPKFVVENLLLDFFQERLVGRKVVSEKETLTAASDWVNGRTREVLIGWDVKEGREMYVRDMDKGGEWRGTTSLHENDKVALELEGEVWTSLVNELMIDICC